MGLKKTPETSLKDISGAVNSLVFLSKLAPNKLREQDLRQFHTNFLGQIENISKLEYSTMVVFYGK